MATIEFVTMLQQIDVFESIPTEILAKIAGAGKVEMRKVRKNTVIWAIRNLCILLEFET